MKRFGNILLWMFSVLLILTGCRGDISNEIEESASGSESEMNCETNTEMETDSTMKSEEAVKEVVFYNKEYNGYRNGVLIQHNHMVSLYEESDANMLYAFEVSVECNIDGDLDYPEDDVIKELLHKAGLLIVTGYSDDSIVVAGTMEDLRSVFEETEYLGNWCLRAEVAVRPDKEPVEEDGIQVILTVPVIMPEATVE